MRRYIQHEPFNIYLFDAAEWQHPVHNHSYFEIIFIRSGHGKHSINGNTFAYGPHDVFLLGPEDYHYFEIEELTSFCYIRFTEIYIKDQTPSKLPGWSRAIEFLLNKPYQNGSIVTDKKGQQMLAHLLTVLVHEDSHREAGTYDLVMNGIMKAMLGILARNLVQQQSEGQKEIKKPQLIQDILLYIHQHILQPDCLRITQLVAKFNLSPDYISAYFKKQTGESLQQYILKHKLKLIENRLLFSELSISQITYEFGFTDPSHLNKLFKKYYGTSPQAFRHKIPNQKL